MSTATTRSARARGGERKTAVVGEAVEHVAARVAGGGATILALIEEQPRLLSLPDVGVITDAVLGDGHERGHLAMEDRDLSIESFERSDLGVVAGEDACRRRHLDQELDDVGQQAIDGLRKRLDDEIVAVAIDDERWQQVAFSVNEAIGGGVEREVPAEGQRLLQPLAPQVAIGGTFSAREHAERDLRRRAVERVAHHPAAAVGDAHGVARRSRHGGDVTPVDPKVARGHPLDGARRNGGDWWRHPNSRAG